jgi:putative hydrolase of the HAD superfamily
LSGILLDIGGVLVRDWTTAAAADWGTRLDIGPEAFLSALYAGNDDTVLIGRVSEADWWDIVAGRLGLDADAAADLRDDLAARETWDESLVSVLRALRGCVPTGVISNAWPGQRDRMAREGLLDLVDEIVLSCEVGCAKPDPGIYTLAAERLGVVPAEILYIDDAEVNVHAAEELGMTGHLHTATATTRARIDAFLGG